ncbi:MAG: AAA family ATPase [Lachnospiraceae bacterium]|nr:AAA family ATPase [Lachnospiraceae bacterium]
MKNIYCIIGPSGSGKTSVANRMSDLYGYSVVRSYTTRPPRYEGEDGYIFVSSQQFNMLGRMYAYTEFDGNEYGVTGDLLDSNDLYIIDPAGAEALRKEYEGTKGIVVIGLCIDKSISEQRMRLRGDTEEKIQRRLSNDEKAFESMYLVADKLVSAEPSIDEISSYLHEWISHVERGAVKHEYSIYDDEGKAVSTNKLFYTKNDALWSLKLAKDMFPNGLPQGWELRDETLAQKERYVDDIKRCRPSFKRSQIEVDIDHSSRSHDGYTYVPFRYNGKAYEYRAYHGEEWVEALKAPLNDLINSAEAKKGTQSSSPESIKRECLGKEK